LLAGSANFVPLLLLCLCLNTTYGVERVKNKDTIKGLKCAALLKMMMMMMKFLPLIFSPFLLSQ
jgi:hypothetical protein